MQISWNDLIPIYIQIADAIENDILEGVLKPGDNCYSQVTIARELNINPATAAKGIRILVDRRILVPVRGQAMTINASAVELIKKRRKKDTLTSFSKDLVLEAIKLDISEEELIANIRELYRSINK